MTLRPPSRIRPRPWRRPARLTARAIAHSAILWLALPGPLRAQQPSACVIARIVDGDTVVCADGRRIRLLLIDAPEMDQGPFGMVARRALEELAPVGTRVTLERDVELHDRYGRTLAYLYLPDGRIVNEELLRAGVAVVSVYPPNVQHVERFRRAVEEAREAKRGLWATEAFECLPADHRAGRCGGVTSVLRKLRSTSSSPTGARSRSSRVRGSSSVGAVACTEAISPRC